MKINILGTDYDFNLINRQDDKRFMVDQELGGLCDFTSKKINILNQSVAAANEQCVQDNLIELEYQVALHELSHAFLRESGLDDDSRDEKLCDWMSIQIPKIFKAYEEAKKILNEQHKEAEPKISNETLTKITELAEQTKKKHK